ncbi:hypothetical protein AGMMS50262_02200 [Bacteroidia bacterium]|nr:hypothetical protein AGMMS50262_02200 [Bacteroidia bacterium]
MNPFSYGTIVKGSNFYDRKEECARIVETLSGGNNLVLYAPRSEKKLDFHFNTALTTVNIAKVIQLKDETKRELPFSMRDTKVLFHNALLLMRFFSVFGNPPNSRKNQMYLQELLTFGAIAA